MPSHSRSGFLHRLQPADKPCNTDNLWFTRRGVRARQEQLEADVRRTWPEHNLRQDVHGRTRACNSFQIKKKKWWRRGESEYLEILKHATYCFLGTPKTQNTAKLRPTGTYLERGFSIGPDEFLIPGELASFNFLGTGEVEPDLATDRASRNVPISSLLCLGASAVLFHFPALSKSYASRIAP